MSGPKKVFPSGSNAGPSSGSSSRLNQPVVDEEVQKLWREMQELQQKEVDILLAKQREQRKEFERRLKERQASATQQAGQSLPPQVVQLQQQFRPQTVPSQPGQLTTEQVKAIEHEQWINQQVLAAYDASNSWPNTNQALQASQSRETLAPHMPVSGPSVGNAVSVLGNVPAQNAPQPVLPQQPMSSAPVAGYWSQPDGFNYAAWAAAAPSTAPMNAAPIYAQGYWYYPTVALPQATPLPIPVSQTMSAPAMHVQLPSASQHAVQTINQRADNGHPNSRPHSVAQPAPPSHATSIAPTNLANVSGSRATRSTVAQSVPVPQRTTYTPTIDRLVNASGSKSTRPTLNQIASATQRSTKIRMIDSLLGRQPVNASTSQVFAHPNASSSSGALSTLPPSTASGTAVIASNESDPPGGAVGVATRTTPSASVPGGQPAGISAITPTSNWSQLTPEAQQFLKEQGIIIRNFDEMLSRTNADLYRYIITDPELKAEYENYKTRPARGLVFDPKDLYKNRLMPIIDRKRKEYNSKRMARQASGGTAHPSTSSNPQSDGTQQPQGSALARALPPGPSRGSAPPATRPSAPLVSTSAPFGADSTLPNDATAMDNKTNQTAPKDTIAHDVLRNLGLLGVIKKRKHEELLAGSQKPSAEQVATVSSNGPPAITEQSNVLSAAGTDIPDPASPVSSHVSDRNGDRAPPEEEEDAPRPRKQRRLLPEYRPPPGSLAAKLFEMPNVPVLRVGNGLVRRARSAVPHVRAEEPAIVAGHEELNEPPLAPPSSDLFQDGAGSSTALGSVGLPSRNSAEPVPGRAEPPHFPNGLMAVPTVPTASADTPIALAPFPPVSSVAMVSTSQDADFSQTALPATGAMSPGEADEHGLARAIVFDSSGSKVAPRTMAPAPAANQSERVPLADSWRDPNAVVTYHPAPKGLVVEVEIPVSRARASLKSSDARRKDRANADPWPHPQSRLHRFECKWGDCTAILDCSKRLKSHVMKRHVEPSTDKICWWDECGINCFNHRKMEKHVHREHLRVYTYICPYEDCSKSYKTETAWSDHMADHPGKERVLRPLAMPLPPQLPEHVPPMPETPVMPAEVLFLPVHQAPIPSDYHEELGPWVLRRILGEVVRDQPRPSTAVSLSPAKGQRDSEVSIERHDSPDSIVHSDDAGSIPPARHRYAFLDGATHQIVNRLPPVVLDDIVREPATERMTVLPLPAPPAVEQAGLAIPELDVENQSQIQLPPEDNMEHEGDEPLFLPDSPSPSPPRPGSSAKTPLFLDDDDDDELLMRPGPSAHNTTGRLFKKSPAVIEVTSDSEEVEAHL